MVVAYDHEARSRKAFIDEAKEKEEAEKRQLAEKMTALAAERDGFKKDSEDLSKHLHRVTLEKKKADEKCAEMEARMLSLEASRQREIEEAVSSARRTAAAEVQSHLNRANELFRRMMKRPIRRMVFLSQAESNLQLLDDMEGATAEEPFDPKAERAFIVENMAKWGSAHEIFDEVAAELRGVLGKNYVVPINVTDIVVSPRIEISAKSVGIHVASGSNDGSLGMRLRSASEELSENGSGETDKGADPAEAAITETQREPTPSVQDPKIGEESSAAIVSRAEERGVEEGELVAEEKDAEDGETDA